MQTTLPHHAPLLGTGAALTDAQPIYQRQQQALQAAQDCLPHDLRDGGPGELDPRALTEALVSAYLLVMRTGGNEVATAAPDGLTVVFQPSGLTVRTARRAPEFGAALVLIATTNGRTDEEPLAILLDGVDLIGGAA